MSTRVTLARLVGSLVFALLVFRQTAGAADVHVFAAASLTDCLKEIAANYHKTNADRIVFSLGGSSMLARQIQDGAPGDIFFSADEAKMDDLEQRGFVIKTSRKSRLSNSLVIVMAVHTPTAMVSPQDLLKPEIKRIAVGDPKAVPIGIYAREYLQKLELWNALSYKIVPTENVRAALAAVEAGNADASIVYKTDAGISTKVKIAFEVPANEGPMISYPVALLREAPHRDAASKFLDYLDSESAAAVFRKFGFIVLPH